MRTKFFHGLPHLLLILTALPLSALHAYADYPYTVTFQTIRPVMLPLLDENPGAGHWGLRTTASIMNVWSIQRSRFIIDGERLQMEASVRYAFTDRVQAGLSLPAISDSGGFNDGIIEGVHRGLGVNQGLRDRFPQNRMNVSYEPYGPYYPAGDPSPEVTKLRSYDFRTYPRVPSDPPVPLQTSWVRPDPGPPAWYAALAKGDAIGYAIARRRENPTIPEDAFHVPWEVIPVSGRDQAGVGNPRLFLQSTLFRNVWIFSEGTAGVQIKFPMSGPTFIATPGSDINAFSVFQIPFGNFRFAAGFGWTHYAASSAYFIRLPRDQSTVRLSAEYGSVRNGEPGGTWMLEGVTFSKPTAGMGELSKPGYLVAIGYRYSWDRLRLSCMFGENLINFGVTPDAGLMFSAEILL